jgi:hypothetical protein
MKKNVTFIAMKLRTIVDITLQIGLKHGITWMHLLEQQCGKKKFQQEPVGEAALTAAVTPVKVCGWVCAGVEANGRKLQLNKVIWLLLPKNKA